MRQAMLAVVKILKHCIPPENDSKAAHPLQIYIFKFIFKMLLLLVTDFMKFQCLTPLMKV